MIYFKYQGEPVGKGRPRVRGAGKHIMMYTPEKTKNFEAAILSEFLTSNKEKTPVFPKSIPLKAEVVIAMKIPKAMSKRDRAKALSRMLMPNKKPDIDNVLKSVFDALNGYAYEDDSQITDIHAEKIYAEEPYVEVTLIPRDWGDGYEHD